MPQTRDPVTGEIIADDDADEYPHAGIGPDEPESEPIEGGA